MGPGKRSQARELQKRSVGSSVPGTVCRGQRTCSNTAVAHVQLSQRHVGTMSLLTELCPGC